MNAFDQMASRISAAQVQYVCGSPYRQPQARIDALGTSPQLVIGLHAEIPQGLPHFQVQNRPKNSIFVAAYWLSLFLEYLYFIPSVS